MQIMQLSMFEGNSNPSDLAAFIQNEEDRYLVRVNISIEPRVDVVKLPIDKPFKVSDYLEGEWTLLNNYTNFTSTEILTNDTDLIINATYFRLHIIQMGLRNAKQPKYDMYKRSLEVLDFFLLPSDLKSLA